MCRHSNLGILVPLCYGWRVHIISSSSPFLKKGLGHITSSFVEHGLCCYFVRSLPKLITHSRDAQTAAGGPDFKRYLHNPVYEVELSSVTQLQYVIASASSRCLSLLLMATKNATSALAAHFFYLPQPNTLPPVRQHGINWQTYRHVWSILRHHLWSCDTAGLSESGEVSACTVNISSSHAGWI